MLDNTQSIICAFGLAAAAPRSPYRHLELCGIALINSRFPKNYDKIFLSLSFGCLFGNPAAAVGMAVVCNVLWGSAFPFIKMGYRLFAIDATDTASIMCFAGVRFMLSALLVYAGGAALRRGPLPMPKGKNLLSCCGLGLWQTAAQYTFYYSAVALLTGAMGGILNSTQSFMGVILAHFCTAKRTA